MAKSTRKLSTKKPAGKKAVVKKAAGKKPAAKKAAAVKPGGKKLPAGARVAGHPYSVHPSLGMVFKWVEEMPAKTGRSFSEWIEFINAKGPGDDASRRGWLKEEHGFGGNEAGWLVERAAGRTGTWPEDEGEYLRAAVGYVEAMFAGAKASLRPVYDELLRIGLSLGDDVKACPCQTMVPFYRKFAFAQLKPTTRTRVDLGLCLPGVKEQGRLLSTGGEAKGDRITHRIGLGSVSEIDEVVVSWFRRAYGFGAASVKKSR